jgi:hypothetical protein
MVEVGAEGVDGAFLVVQVAVDRHALALFPALDGGYVAMEICGDFLPRVEAV